VKNILLLKLIGRRPQTQSTVQFNADTFTVLPPLLLRLETDDVTLDKLTLSRPLPQQAGKLITMTLTSCWWH